MINKFEISRKAKEFGLQASAIEKDYVLGWMLIGIQKHPQTKDSWVFIRMEEYAASSGKRAPTIRVLLGTFAQYFLVDL